MTILTGLKREIQSSMIRNLQNKVIEAVLQAAKNGRTSCEVDSKRLNKQFLSDLETEGITHEELEGKVNLAWEMEVHGQ